MLLKYYMRVIKASFGMDQNIMDLFLKTDWVTGQIRSPGYHGNHTKDKCSLFKNRLISPPLKMDLRPKNSIDMLEMCIMKKAEMQL